MSDSIKTSNKFLKSAVIISLLISILQYVFALLISFGGAAKAWIWVFIPAVIVGFIFLIGKRTTTKHPLATKIVTAILNIFIILFIQLFICGILTLFEAEDYEKDVTEISGYKHALLSIGWQENISHFPKKLPANASNINIYKTEHKFFGSEEIYLIFDTDKDYIEKELEKYKFKFSEGPFTEKTKYDERFHWVGLNRLDTTGYKVYYLNDKEYTDGRYCNGIAVKGNTIMYFYSYPD